MAGAGHHLGVRFLFGGNSLNFGTYAHPLIRIACTELALEFWFLRFSVADSVLAGWGRPMLLTKY